jgi:GNAT superfamily N-acetyltransferase
MNKGKRRTLSTIAEAIDTDLLTGKVNPLPNLPALSQLSGLEEIRSFRRRHPSLRIQAEIARLLATRRECDLACDIMVSRRESSWDWRHSEMRLRSRIFELMEVADLLWELRDYSHDLRRDGWLLVEDRRIVGATEFRQEETSWGRVWIWFWVYVDPEYRRQGVVTRRIPRWERQYPSMIIDQPNPHMSRLIRKTGLHQRCRIKGPSIRVGDDRICVTTTPEEHA